MNTVVVVALDRLGRSLAGIVRTVETLRERGIVLRSLREGMDYSTPVGRMVAGIFASLAEYERELIHERAAVARQAARARGKQTGRPRALSPDQGPHRPPDARRWRIDVHDRRHAASRPIHPLPRPRRHRAGH